MSFWNKTKKFLGFGDALENTKRSLPKPLKRSLSAMPRLTTTSWMIWRSP